MKITDPEQASRLTVLEVSPGTGKTLRRWSFPALYAARRRPCGQWSIRNTVPARREQISHGTTELQMIERLTVFPPAIVAFACKGQVTRRDYETVLLPAIEAALKQHQKLRLYYRTDPDFSAFDAGAIWEDFKVGIAHFFRWDRIAVVTNVSWIRHAVNAFRFLIPGTVKIFSLDEAYLAREWIVAMEDR
jgi:hypothetical protein